MGSSPASGQAGLSSTGLPNGHHHEGQPSLPEEHHQQMLAQEASPVRVRAVPKCIPLAVPVARRPHRMSGPLKIAHGQGKPAGKKGGGWKKRQRVPLVDCAPDVGPQHASPSTPIQQANHGQQHPPTSETGPMIPQQDLKRPKNQHPVQPSEHAVIAISGGINGHGNAGSAGPGKDRKHSIEQQPAGTEQSGTAPCDADRRKRHLSEQQPRPCSSTEGATGVFASDIEARRRSSPQSAHLAASSPQLPGGQSDAHGHPIPAAEMQDRKDDSQRSPQAARALVKGRGADAVMEDPDFPGRSNREAARTVARNMVVHVKQIPAQGEDSAMRMQGPCLASFQDAMPRVCRNRLVQCR